ncbi:glutathione S-transferase family protein [Gloeocapsopsis dulcis]|uniref:Glutathione S-transferase n=1 Tax=Gloeocapsopsis dulcis AAB1 = 1H9 TaxID=1433147 RepID=A0A6N8FZW5_9CHRO|nr:glutathione S-transferase family protein [Gloeocapsopsis dulcis]MUL38501.1 glutathione S-transferase [Gloeocapsopsis dulcis AAB1 = 1H9]WNN91637.1 glutathione S-transferase family protein [Gloeocapsopsis dulcis]
MLELYQFELSQYSEKVRLILDFKGLEYRKIEVTPGVGQLELFRLTGQRQVPVLKDGNQYIADSTEIAKYLERKYPDRPIIPSDPKQRAVCLLIEEWADESIGIKSRKALFGALSQSENYRKSLLPMATPDLVKTLVGVVPNDVLRVLGFGVGYGPDVVKSAEEDLKQDLEVLCLLLAESPYLVGDQPTLADLAVAGLSILLKFPDKPYLELPATLKGKGIPGLGDNIAYQSFFDWRDRLYVQYRKPITQVSTIGSTPTSIQID